MTLADLPDDLLFEIGRYLYDCNFKHDIERLLPLMSSCRSLQNGFSRFLLFKRWNFNDLSQCPTSPFEEVCRRRRISSFCKRLIAQAVDEDAIRRSRGNLDQFFSAMDRPPFLAYCAARFTLLSSPEDIQAVVADCSVNLRLSILQHILPINNFFIGLDADHRITASLCAFLVETLQLSNHQNQCYLLDLLGKHIPGHIEEFANPENPQGWSFLSSLLQLLLPPVSPPSPFASSMGETWAHLVSKAAKEQEDLFRASKQYSKLSQKFPAAVNVNPPLFMPSSAPVVTPVESRDWKALKCLKRLGSTKFLPFAKVFIAKMKQHGLKRWLQDDVVAASGTTKTVKLEVPQHDRTDVLELKEVDDISLICFALHIINFIVDVNLDDDDQCFWNLLRDDEHSMWFLLSETINLFPAYAPVRDTDPRIATLFHLANDAAKKCIFAILTASQYEDAPDTLKNVEEDIPELLEREIGLLPSARDIILEAPPPRKRYPEEIDVAMFGYLNATEYLPSFLVHQAMTALLNDEGSATPDVLNFLATTIQKLEDDDNMDDADADEDPEDWNGYALEILAQHLDNSPEVMITSYSFLRITWFSISRISIADRENMEQFSRAFCKALKTLSSRKFEKPVPVLALAFTFEKFLDTLQVMYDHGSLMSAGLVTSSMEFNLEAVKAIKNRILKEVLLAVARRGYPYIDFLEEDLKDEGNDADARAVRQARKHRIRYDQELQREEFYRDVRGLPRKEPREPDDVPNSWDTKEIAALGVQRRGEGGGAAGSAAAAAPPEAATFAQTENEKIARMLEALLPPGMAQYLRLIASQLQTAEGAEEEKEEEDDEDDDEEEEEEEEEEKEEVEEKEKEEVEPPAATPTAPVTSSPTITSQASSTTPFSFTVPQTAQWWSPSSFNFGDGSQPAKGSGPFIFSSPPKPK